MVSVGSSGHRSDLDSEEFESRLTVTLVRVGRRWDIDRANRADMT